MKVVMVDAVFVSYRGCIAAVPETDISVMSVLSIFGIPDTFLRIKGLQDPEYLFVLCPEYLFVLCKHRKFENNT